MATKENSDENLSGLQSEISRLENILSKKQPSEVSPTTLKTEKVDSSRLKALMDELKGEVNKVANTTARPAVRNAPGLVSTVENIAAATTNKSGTDFDNPVFRSISDAAKNLLSKTGVKTEEEKALDAALSQISKNMGIPKEEAAQTLKPQGRGSLIQSLRGLGEIKTATGQRLIFKDDGSIERVIG